MMVVLTILNTMGLIVPFDTQSLKKLILKINSADDNKH